MFYKVVSSAMQSACTSVGREYGCEFVVTYRVGEWVRPQVAHTKLFVFDNFDDAARFRANRQVIFQCEVENPTSRYNLFIPQVFADNFVSLALYRIQDRIHRRIMQDMLAEDEYDMYVRAMRGARSDFAPEGTKYVDAVKLIKAVYRPCG